MTHPHLLLFIIHSLSASPMDFSLTASNISMRSNVTDHPILNEDSERMDLLRNEPSTSASHQSDKKLNMFSHFVHKQV